MKTVEAVYEDGVFRPLGPVDLEEGERVVIPLREMDPLEMLTHIYDGLSEEEIEEIDREILGHRHRDRERATA